MMVKFFKIDYWIDKLKRYELISNEKRMVKMVRERKKNVFQRAQETFQENMNMSTIIEIRENIGNFVGWLDYFPLLNKKKIKENKIFRVYNNYKLRKIQVEIRIKEVKEKNEQK